MSALCTDGSLCDILDRKKDLIVTGGFNVYPKEVEGVINSHPAVAMCAMIGTPDPHWGEAVTAVLIVQSGATLSADELVALVRSRKGATFTPKRVDFVERLPLTGVGKIDKKQIRATYWVGRDRKVG